MAHPTDLKAGDFVKWSSSGGMARGRVKRVIRNGQIELPETGAILTATPDNPAAVIRVWRKSGGKYAPTKRTTAQRFAALSKTKALRVLNLEAIDDLIPSTKVSTIKSIDEDKRIVYGLVYEPNTIDSHGDIMTVEEIEKMAHRFMQIDKLDKTIDVNHDGVPISATPIESYIAKAGDPHYQEGAWVLGVKIYDEQIWRDIKTGRLNGFSFEAMVKKFPRVVEYDFVANNFGATESALNHTHMFFAELDADGKVVRGRTSSDYGHSHEIIMGTATEFGGTTPHKHRFFVE